MTTIRRVYMFLVCSISLHWGLLSVIWLGNMILRSLLGDEAFNYLGVTFALANIIVSTPVFVGHWLWAEVLARRDGDERLCLERYLYMEAMVGAFTVYLALSVFFLVDALLRLLLPATLLESNARSGALSTTLTCLPALALVGGAWFYHRWVSARDEKTDARPLPERPALVRYFFNLGFAGTGTALTVVGTAALLTELLNLPDARSLAGFSLAAGALAAGVALWTVHQRRLARDPSAQLSLKLGARWVATQLFAWGGVILALFGLIRSQLWLVNLLNHDADTTLPVALGVLLTGLPLAVYHEWVLWRAPQDGGLRTVRQLYATVMNLVGLALAMVGAGNILMWVINSLAGERSPLPALLTCLVPGLITWVYFEIELYRTTSIARWWQGLGLSLVGVVVAAFGTAGLQAWVMGLIGGDSYTLGAPVSAMLVGVPVWLYYEFLIYRYRPQGQAPVRWLVAWGVQGIAAALSLFGSVQFLRWLFALLSGDRLDVYWGASAVVAGGLTWLYYQRVMRRSEGGIPFLRRLSVYVFAGLTVGLTTFGLIGVQEWLIARFTGNPVFRLPDALAALITGLPAWLYFWRSAQRLVAGGQPDEQKSDLRKIYLYLIIYLSVHGAVVTIGLLAHGLLRALFGLPTSGSLGLSFSIITASIALWTYHAFVLRSDIRRALTSSLQNGMQRLYWYLVAAVGLLAFLLGLAGSLGGALRLITSLLSGDGFTTALRGQLAASIAALVAGLPVWASAWFPAQRVALAPSPEGVQMRHSVLRKGYLYFFLLTATLSALVFSIAVVYQVLYAFFILRIFSETLQVLTEIGQALGFALIAIALWLYHTGVLRKDGRLALHEKEQAAQDAGEQLRRDQQLLRERWAAFPIAVVDADQGEFAQAVLAELRRTMPHLTTVAVGLTHAARAALRAADPPIAPDQPPPAEPDPQELLAGARLIVAAWTVAGPGSLVAQSSAAKLIVPVAFERSYWVGVITTAASAATIVQTVRQYLDLHPLPLPEPSVPAPQPPL